MERRKATITGVGMILMAGIALLVWKKGGKQRAKLANWKRQKIENAYYNNVDERDIAWG